MNALFIFGSLLPRKKRNLPNHQTPAFQSPQGEIFSDYCSPFSINLHEPVSILHTEAKSCLDCNANPRSKLQPYRLLLYLLHNTPSCGPYLGGSSLGHKCEASHSFHLSLTSQHSLFFVTQIYHTTSNTPPSPSCPKRRHYLLVLPPTHGR